jgi:SMC interacting uncharacterized protein involved in chromosome segregation
MADEQRLERMENKIDELTKVVTSMARIEERMITLFKRMETYEFRHDNLDGRIVEVEKTITKTGVVDQVLEKGFWVVIGGGIAYVVKVFGE